MSNLLINLQVTNYNYTSSGGHINLGKEIHIFLYERKEGHLGYDLK